MKKKSRIATRKVRFLEAELRMLQKYSMQVDALYSEYSVEYTKDMSTLLESAANIAPRPEDPERPTDQDNHDGETINIDPTKSSQTWRKTADGWVLEDSEDLIDEDEYHEPDKQARDVPHWAKKIYKKIALASHPDRTSKDLQHKKLKEIFLQSAAAMDSGDFSKLLGLALEIDIDIASDNDVDMLPLLSSRVSALKQELSGTESTPEWLWGEGLGTPEIRFPLANLFLTSKGYNLKRDDILDIILQIEE